MLVGRVNAALGGKASIPGFSYLTKKTPEDWQKLQSDIGLSSDNDVAVFSLQRSEILIDSLASEVRCSVSRLVSLCNQGQRTC